VPSAPLFFNFLPQLSAANVVFLLCYVAYSVIYIARKAFSVVKTHMQEELGITTSSLGIVDSSFLGSYALFQFFLPRIAEKIGTRKFLVACFVGSSCCCLLFGVSSTPAAFISLWFFQGIFQSSIFPVLLKAMGPWFTGDSRGRVLGFWTTSQQFGGMIATALSAYLCTTSGWRMAFVIPALLLALMAIMLWTYLHEPPMAGSISSSIQLCSTSTRRLEKRVSDASDYSVVGETGCADEQKSLRKATSNRNLGMPSSEPTTLSLVQVICIPSVAQVAGSYFCVKLVRYSMLLWLPYFLIRHLHYEASVAAYSSMMFDIGAIGGAIFTGFFSDRVLKGKRIVAAAIMAVVTSVFLLTLAFAANSYDTGKGPGGSILDEEPRYLVHGPVYILALIGLVGFGVAGPDSILGASASQDICDRPSLNKQTMLASLATVAGVINGVGALGACAQGYLTALVSESLGWGWLFGFLGGTVLLGSFLLIPSVLLDCGDIFIKSHKSGSSVDRVEDTFTVI